MNSIDPRDRSRFIRDLRKLADFLEANTMVPVPAAGAEIIVSAGGGEHLHRRQVESVADLLGVAPIDDGHYTAERSFGSGTVRYRAVAIPPAVRRTPGPLRPFAAPVVARSIERGLPR